MSSRNCALGARSSSNDLNTTTSGDGPEARRDRDAAHLHVRIPTAVDAHGRAVRPARGGHVRARLHRERRARPREAPCASTAAGMPAGP